MLHTHLSISYLVCQCFRIIFLTLSFCLSLFLHDFEICCFLRLALRSGSSDSLSFCLPDLSIPLNAGALHGIKRAAISRLLHRRRPYLFFFLSPSRHSTSATPPPASFTSVSHRQKAISFAAIAFRDKVSLRVYADAPIFLCFTIKTIQKLIWLHLLETFLLSF
jgi:hypothetical protein